MSVDNLPFVQIKTSIEVPTKRDGTVTTPINLRFLATDPEAPPRSADYGVTDAAKAAKLDKALAQLTDVNDQVLEWLMADADHTIRFAKDPVGALREAVPKFDFSALQELGPDIFK